MTSHHPDLIIYNETLLTLHGELLGTKQRTHHPYLKLTIHSHAGSSTTSTSFLSSEMPLLHYNVTQLSHNTRIQIFLAIPNSISINFRLCIHLSNATHTILYEGLYSRLLFCSKRPLSFQSSGVGILVCTNFATKACRTFHL